MPVNSSSAMHHSREGGTMGLASHCCFFFSRFTLSKEGEER